LGDLTSKIDEFVTDWAPSQGPVCSVRAMLDALPSPDNEAVERLLASKVFATDVAKFLQDEVLPAYNDDPEFAVAMRIKADAIQRHRRGACGCARGA
jgi:hypothetical protein